MDTLCLANEMKMLGDALEFITIFYFGLVFSTSTKRLLTAVTNYPSHYGVKIIPFERDRRLP
jgi:hypothetical protein